MSNDNSAAFLAAADAIKRRGEKPPNDARLLFDPALRPLALDAFRMSRGPMVTDATAFPMTFWDRGVLEEGNALGGLPFDRFLAKFYRTPGSPPPPIAFSVFTHLLRIRASVVQAKRTGWVVNPTTNTNGWRGNDSTTAMHALLLDCDGTGEWVHLQAWLEHFGLAHILYQSGGWSPTTPKWRCVLPLARPFDVSEKAKRPAWKRAYWAARVIFGAVAGLTGEGFDSNCDPPAQPWFLSERRSEADPDRVVLFKQGFAFDLDAFLAALPALPLPAKVVRTGPRPDPVPLDDERLEFVTASLAEATAKTGPGRRNLYFHMTDALLDFGIAPDDVLSVVEEVSARHGGDDDLHEDNVGIARYVVSKFEDDEGDPSAGPLAEHFPRVKAALDRALPDVVATRKAAFLDSDEGEVWKAEKREENQQFRERLLKALGERDGAKAKAPEPAPEPPVLTQDQSRMERLRGMLDPVKPKLTLDEARAKIRKALRDA